MAHHGRNLKKSELSMVKSKGGKITAPETDYPEELVRAETNRPVLAGVGRHRGDRRDTNRYYTNNTKHSARGNTPRRDVSTRAR